MWMFIAWDSLASKKILTWATGQDQFDAWCVEMFRCLRWKFFFCFAIESTEGVKFIWYDTVSSESLYICCVELQSRQSCPDIHKMQHEAVVFYNNQCYARYMSYLAASLPFLDSFSWINLSCTLDVCITSSDFSLLSRQKGLYSTCVVGAWVYWSGNRYRGRPMDVGCNHWGHWCQYEEPCVTWMMSCGMLWWAYSPVGTDASKFHGVFGTVEP